MSETTNYGDCNISVSITTDGMGDHAEHIDAYAAAFQAALEQEFPGASVVVEVGNQARLLVERNSEERRDLNERVFLVGQDVFNRPETWVG